MLCQGIGACESSIAFYKAWSADSLVFLNSWTYQVKRNRKASPWYDFSCALSKHIHWHEAYSSWYNHSTRKYTSSALSQYVHYVCAPPACPYCPNLQHCRPSKHISSLAHGFRHPQGGGCLGSLALRRRYQRICNLCLRRLGLKWELHARRSPPASVFWREA